MGLKPIKKAEDVEESEVEYSDDGFEDEEAEIKEAVKPKKQSKPEKEVPQEEENDPVNRLTKEEVVDMISGNLNRAYQLLQYLR